MEKRTCPLTKEYNEALKTTWEYYDILFSCPCPPIRPPELRPVKFRNYSEWSEKVIPLSDKVLKLYRSLKQELGLQYDFRNLSWVLIEFTDKDGSLFDKLRKFAWALQELRDKKEREWIELQLIEQGKTPPQPGLGEGKDIKKFFINNWQWLIGAIIGFIGMIFVILQFLVMKK